MANSNSLNETILCRVGRALLTICAHPDYREEILGDLEEQLSCKARKGPTSSTADWYQGQLYGSLLSLAWARLLKTPFPRLAMFVLGNAIFFWILFTWDKDISHTGVDVLRSASFKGNFGVVRSFYFASYLGGVVLASLPIAIAMLRKDMSSFENGMILLGPALLAMNVYLLADMVRYDGYSLFGFVFMRMLLLPLGMFVAIRVARYALIHRFGFS